MHFGVVLLADLHGLILSIFVEEFSRLDGSKCVANAAVLGLLSASS